MNGSTEELRGGRHRLAWEQSCAIWNSQSIESRDIVTVDGSRYDRSPETREECAMNIVVVLLVLLLLLGGGGFYAGGPLVGGSLGGIVLLVLIVLLVTGGLRRA
jgi:hypothetical protein